MYLAELIISYSNFISCHFFFIEHFIFHLWCLNKTFSIHWLIHCQLWALFSCCWMGSSFSNLQCIFVHPIQPNLLLVHSSAVPVVVSGDVVCDQERTICHLRSCRHFATWCWLVRTTVICRTCACSSVNWSLGGRQTVALYRHQPLPPSSSQLTVYMTSLQWRLPAAHEASDTTDVTLTQEIHDTVQIIMTEITLEAFGQLMSDWLAAEMPDMRLVQCFDLATTFSWRIAVIHWYRVCVVDVACSQM